MNDPQTEPLKGDFLSRRAFLGGIGKTTLAGAVDLASDVADQPAEPGAQELELLVHALELLGVGVAPGHHRGALGEAGVGLPERHAVFFRQLAQLADRRLQQPGIGRESDVLGLLAKTSDADLSLIPGAQLSKAQTSVSAKKITLLDHGQSKEAGSLGRNK